MGKSKAEVADKLVADNFVAGSLEEDIELVGPLFLKIKLTES